MVAPSSRVMHNKILRLTGAAIVVGLPLALLSYRVLVDPKGDATEMFTVHELSNERKRVSLDAFQDSFDQCRVRVPSTSRGLINDAAILCHTLRNESAYPNLHLEEYYTNNAAPTDWLVVNLDTTNFPALLQRWRHYQMPPRVLCKTPQTLEVLTRKGFPPDRLSYIGFTSIDLQAAGFRMDYRRFLHVAGKSPYKGTESVLGAWLAHPHWPVLTLVCREDPYGGAFAIVADMLGWDSGDYNRTPGNIRVLTHLVPEGELSALVNTHGVHVCPSKNEGFGHAANEARSVGAVALYTDNPPLSDLFQNAVTGIGIPSRKEQDVNRGYCPRYFVHTKKFSTENIRNPSCISSIVMKSYVKSHLMILICLKCLLTSYLWMDLGHEIVDCPHCTRIGVTVAADIANCVWICDTTFADMRYIATAADVALAVTRVLAMDVRTLERIGANARAAFERDRAEFQEKLQTEIRGPHRLAHTLHSVWIDRHMPLENAVLPSAVAAIDATWQSMHPDMQHRVWSGKDVHHLVKTQFPEYSTFYASLAQSSSAVPTMRHFASFLIVYAHGGVYHDPTLRCFRSVSPLLTAGSYYILEAAEHSSQNQSDGSRPISAHDGHNQTRKAFSTRFFSAAAGSTFIRSWLDRIAEKRSATTVDLYAHYLRFNGEDIWFGNPCVVALPNRSWPACKNAAHAYMGTEES
eukprot:m.61891 g.61891  ORF g.61891 m.61891 type:complete len:690 (+) comp15778_c0_seq8:308-2377(+)